MIASASEPRFGGAVSRWLLSTAKLVLWVFVYATFLLSMWVALGWAIGGWKPIVITSGSMEPTLSAGDVLLVEPDPGATIGQRSIVVFERDGATIAHRVFAVDDDRLVTKGDANASPDVGLVEADDVRGVGKLMVPFVGLPLMWWNDGQWLAFAAWATLVAAAAVRTVTSLERSLARLAPRRNRRDDRRHLVARLGVQRARILMAVLVVAQYLIDPDRFAGGTSWVNPIALVAGTVAILVGTNVLGTLTAVDPRRARASALFELATDTALVVVLAMATGSSGFSWVLFSLPIVEAAVRFRLVGALVHWMLLTFLTIGANVWEGANDPSSVVLEDLKAILDQLSVLFLVVVPAAYLAEQLLGELTTWQDATGQARGRSQLLVRVADIGREIVRLDGGNIDTILGGTRSLGFDRVDIVLGQTDDSWLSVAGDEMPTPGDHASGVRTADLALGAVFVDLDDPDDAEVDALVEHGLAAVVAQVVGERNGQRIVLRAAMEAGGQLTPEIVEAFRLVAGQAAVAMRNEQLLDQVTTMHAELEHRAHHDALTGLPNRALLLERLGEAYAGSGAPVVFFLDLNGFKPVNDRLGHDAGDVLLQHVASRLLSTAPAGATVARLGGDEFTILVPEAMARSAAVTAAEAVIAAVREPYDIGRDVVAVSTSVGIAFGGPGVAAAELIRRADVAMYEAKHGPNRRIGYELYRPDFDADAEHRAERVADIAEAIRSGAVTVAFQPLFEVGAEGRRLLGAEALVRWEHPVLGFVPPPEILETAKSADLQGQLTRLIVGQACRAAAGWHALDPTGVYSVAVNASPDELAADYLVPLIGDVIAEAGLPVDRFLLEISERLVSPASEVVLRNVESLRAHGIGLLLDDFGQGNSSLSYLHELPLVGIKLDRQLVVNAQRSEADRIVLRSIVELSQRLGHAVIAEGVETQDHLRSVVDAGCTIVQGYLLGRPVPPSELDQLVLAERRRRDEAHLRVGPPPLAEAGVLRSGPGVAQLEHVQPIRPPEVGLEPLPVRRGRSPDVVAGGAGHAGAQPDPDPSRPRPTREPLPAPTGRPFVASGQVT